MFTFDFRAKLPETAGIYFVFVNTKSCKLVYIGKTNNFKKRWQTHDLLRLLEIFNLLEIPVFLRCLELSWDIENIELMEIYLIRKFSPIFNIKHDRAKLAERVLNVDFFEQAQQYSVSDAPILQTPSSELLAAVSARIENRALENMSFVEVESIAFALGLHVPCRTNKSSLVLQVKFCLQEYYTSDDIKDLPHQNERLGSAIRYTAKRSRKVISQEILSKVYCDLYALNIRELKRMASGLCVFRYSEMTKAELIQSIEQVRKKYTQDSSNDP